MATRTRVWVVKKPASVSPCRLQKLRTEENIKCRQVLDVSPPLCLPPGDFVVFIKKAAKNLEGQFLSTIDDADQESSGDLKQLAGVLKQDDVVDAVPELTPLSSVSQETLEPPRKQRKLEISPGTQLIFELKKKMEAMEAMNTSFQGRLATLEKENGELKKRVGIYHSTGVSLVAAACSLVEYAADQISFRQRMLIASTLLRELTPAAKLQGPAQLLQFVNARFRHLWHGFGYVEDVRFNAYLKRLSRPGVERHQEEDALAIRALQAIAYELNSSAGPAGELARKLRCLMDWYVNSYRLVRNKEVHVFGIFNDPAYENEEQKENEELKEEEDEEEEQAGRKKKRKRKNKGGKRGKFNPKTIEELEQRLQALCHKPPFGVYSREEVETKLAIHQNFVENIDELPAPFLPHLDVIKSLASHAHSELLKLRDVSSNRHC